MYLSDREHTPIERPPNQGGILTPRTERCNPKFPQFVKWVARKIFTTCTTFPLGHLTRLGTNDMIQWAVLRSYLIFYRPDASMKVNHTDRVSRDSVCPVTA